MNKETLEAIEVEIEARIKGLLDTAIKLGIQPQPSANSFVFSAAYLEGAQSKAARDYWIRWAFELGQQSADLMHNCFDETTVEDLIALADKESDEK